MVDENDVRHIENMGAQAVWTPAHVPRRFFRAERARTRPPAVFIGSAYQRRAKYLQNERLRGLLEFRASAEHATDLPAMFDQFNGEVRQALLGNDYRQADYEHFVDTMWKLRAKLFDVYLDEPVGEPRDREPAVVRQDLRRPRRREHGDRPAGSDLADSEPSADGTLCSARTKRSCSSTATIPPDSPTASSDCATSPAWPSASARDSLRQRAPGTTPPSTAWRRSSNGPATGIVPRYWDEKEATP